MTALDSAAALFATALKLSEDDAAHLVATASLRLTPPGTVVIREGDQAEAAYIVARGLLQVQVRDSAGLPRVVARLEAGTLFGEQALLPGRSQRNATVIAVEESQVWTIPAAAFRQLLGRQPQLAALLDAEGRRQALGRLARQSNLLSALTDALPTHEGLIVRHLRDNERLFAEGDPADAAYVVLRGVLLVQRPNDQGQPTTLSRLGAGELVGELAVLENQSRAASVVASGSVEVLGIPAEAFRQALAQLPDLAALTETLKAVYRLPQRGLVVRHSGYWEGEPCVVCAFRLPDDRRAAARRLLRQAVTDLSITDAEPSQTLRSPDGQVELRLHRQVIVGITAPTEWPDLSVMAGWLLDGRPLEPWRRIAFETRGTCLLAPPPSFGRDDERVCHCLGTTVGAVRAAISMGAHTAEAVGHVTGAGTVCSGCMGPLALLIGREDYTLCRLSTRSLDDHQLLVSLAPLGGMLTPTQAGQQVQVEALCDGAWVARRYWVVNPRAADRYDIAVTREQDDPLSHWFYQAPEGSLVRVSPPLGKPIDLQNGRPLVYLVGDAGAVVAIATVRSQPLRPTTVIYSAALARAAWLPELKQLASLHFIELHFHDSTEYTLTPIEIVGHLSRQPDAELVVCGPSALTDTGLQAVAQVPSVQVQIVRLETASQPLTDLPLPPLRPLPCPTLLPGPSTPNLVTAVGTPREETEGFLQRFFVENRVPTAFSARWDEVQPQLLTESGYQPTPEELAYGVRIAWRQSRNAFERPFWPDVAVRDVRHLHHPDDVAHAVFTHLELAYNGGAVRPLVTLFQADRANRPGPRLWNPALPLFSSQRHPQQAAFVAAITKLGWHSSGDLYEVLPLVVECAGFAPQIYPVPPEKALAVALVHPEHLWFKTLNLRWNTLMAVADQPLWLAGQGDRSPLVSGVQLSRAVVAWLQEAEGESLLLRIAGYLRLDTQRDASLWRLKAMTTLEEAVLWSFERAGVTVVETYSAARRFAAFVAAETAANRPLCHRDQLQLPLLGSLGLAWDQWPNYAWSPAFTAPAP